MERATEDMLPREALGKLDEVVEVTSKALRLPSGRNEDILKHLACGGDFSRWGVLNAVTRTAEDIEMERRDWDKITAEVLRN